MKIFIKIILLIFSVRSYGEIIFYDMDLGVNANPRYGAGGHMSTTISIDTDTGALTSIEAELTRLGDPALELDLNWSGTHSMVWDLNEFALGAHELRLRDLFFSSGDYISYLDFEFYSPPETNPYYNLNHIGDAIRGLLITQAGEQIQLSAGPISKYYTVHEPATMILFGLGLLGISIKRREI